METLFKESLTGTDDMYALTLPTLNEKEKNKDMSIVKLGGKLGRGGYGTVFECRDDQGTPMAVKCITTSTEGIPCLMEASIMSVIHHPYLNSAIKICAEPTMLYIIQPLAISDIRKYLSTNIVNNDQLIKWCHQLLQAVACLHKRNLIHGDIKAANILIYSDGHIKLADFTLTTLASWPNHFKPCTSTHRPLEVWLGTPEYFTKAVDIWALGCTFFELLYSRSLFANQDKDPSINAIIDWANLGPRGKQGLSNVIKRPDFYHSFSLPSSFDVSNSLNRLLLDMLTVDHTRRPKINVLLNDDIFRGFLVVPTTIIDSPQPIPTIQLPKLKQSNLKGNPKVKSKPKLTKLDKQLDKMTKDLAVKQLGNELYLRTTGAKVGGNISDSLKLNTCVWIATKLILRVLIPKHELKFPFHEILQTERLICHHLNFRLHSTGSDCIFVS